MDLQSIHNYLATVDGKIPEAFLWLAAALFVDGVDGTLARAVNVNQNTPEIDGAILDNIIDYLNYVVVPVFIFYMLIKRVLILCVIV